MLDDIGAVSQQPEGSADSAVSTKPPNGTDIALCDPPKVEDIAMVSVADDSRHRASDELPSRPTSPIHQILVEIQPDAPKVTTVQEAQYKIDALNMRLDVHAKEKALAQSRMNECNAAYRLYNAQFALAEQSMFEVDMEVGRAKNALAMARRTAKAFRFVDLFRDERQVDLGIAATVA